MSAREDGVSSVLLFFIHDGSRSDIQAIDQTSEPPDDLSDVTCLLERCAPPHPHNEVKFLVFTSHFYTNLDDQALVPAGGKSQNTCSCDLLSCWSLMYPCVAAPRRASLFA